MEEIWDGMDRRKRVRRENGERRSFSGEQCPLHDLIWKQHDQDRKENRETMVDEVKQLKRLAGSMTPWKVFALSTVIMLAAIGWLGHRVDQGQVKVTEEIQISINSLSEDIKKIQKKIIELHENDQVKNGTRTQ